MMKSKTIFEKEEQLTKINKKEQNDVLSFLATQIKPAIYLSQTKLMFKITQFMILGELA